MAGVTESKGTDMDIDMTPPPHVSAASVEALLNNAMFVDSVMSYVNGKVEAEADWLDMIKYSRTKKFFELWKSIKPEDINRTVFTAMKYNPTNTQVLDAIVQTMLADAETKNATADNEGYKQLRQRIKMMSDACEQYPVLSDHLHRMYGPDSTLLPAAARGDTCDGHMLMCAVITNDVAKLRAALPTINTKTSDSYSYSPRTAFRLLRYAGYFCCYEVFVEVLNWLDTVLRKDTVNCKVDDRMEPNTLQWCIVGGDLRIVRLMLERGESKVNVHSFVSAVMHEDEVTRRSLVDLLVEFGVKEHPSYQVMLNESLKYSACVKDTSIMRWMLDMGATPCLETYENAEAGRHQEHMDLLVDIGFDVVAEKARSDAETANPPTIEITSHEELEKLNDPYFVHRLWEHMDPREPGNRRKIGERITPANASDMADFMWYDFSWNYFPLRRAFSEYAQYHEHCDFAEKENVTNADSGYPKVAVEPGDTVHVRMPNGSIVEGYPAQAAIWCQVFNDQLLDAESRECDWRAEPGSDACLLDLGMFGIPQATAEQLLAYLVQLSEFAARFPVLHIKKPVYYNVLDKSVVPPCTADLVNSMGEDTHNMAALVSLLRAAEVLRVTHLVEAIHAKFGEFINGRTPEDLAEMFDVTISPEMQTHLRSVMLWPVFL